MYKLSALLLALTLAACTTVTQQQAGVALAGAIAGEAAVQLRCPRTPAERVALATSRAAFDATFGPHLAPEQLSQLYTARAATDGICAAA